VFSGDSPSPSTWPGGRADYGSSCFELHIMVRMARGRQVQADTDQFAVERSHKASEIAYKAFKVHSASLVARKWRRCCDRVSHDKIDPALQMLPKLAMVLDDGAIARRGSAGATWCGSIKSRNARSHAKKKRKPWPILNARPNGASRSGMGGGDGATSTSPSSSFRASRQRARHARS
jgi:hypothetical protein